MVMADRWYGVAVWSGWIIFAAYWLVSARRAKRNIYVSQGWGNWAPARLALLAVSFVVFHLGSVRGSRFAYGSFAVHSLAWKTTGLALFAAGLLFAVWARIYLGANWGMPMSRKDQPELVTSGPYRYVRHPIYSGMLAGMLGTALATSLYWLVALVVAGGYFIYSAFREEQYMLAQFPDTYPAYKRRTKMLLPLVL